MAGDTFRDLIASGDELRALLGTPSDLAVRKQLAALDGHCRAFIACSPFVLVATADRDGRVDVSPKGDPAGFVHVLDDTHLVIPDRPGNKRLDGMQNILANPQVGLLFVVPGRADTLRVNGRACLTRDPALLARMAVAGKPPRVGIGVEVEEVFFHCAKAFHRSGLWTPERWPDASSLAGPARVFFDQTRPTDETLEQLTERLETGNRTSLY